MATLNRVKAARKPGKCSKCGKPIEVGDPYLWWAFRHGPKYKRCTEHPPRQSELIASPFLSGMAESQEEIEDALETFHDGGSVEDLQATVESVAAAIRERGEEAQGSFDNMPEGLQQGETGQMLETRAERCEEIASELEDLDLNSVWEQALTDEGLTNSEINEGAVEDMTDEELESLRSELNEDEREPEETDEEYKDRVKTAIFNALENARCAVGSELENISLEVE